jgi:hypothetical protein
MIQLGMGLDAAVALFKRYKALLVILPLCLALAWQTYQVSRWKGRSLEKDAIISNMQLASEQARAAQLALNQATEAKYRTLAEIADHAHEKELSDARSRAADYAGRNGLRSYCQGSAGQAGSPAESPVAPSDNGPGADAIVLNRNDFDQLVENTLRLKAAHDWGLAMVKQGLAEYPEPKLSGE